MTFDLLADEFFEQPDLLLLDFQKVLPFLLAEIVELFLNRADFELRFEVYLVIVLGVLAVFGFLPVLRHHDDRRLDRGDHREKEVQQNVRVRVEAAIEQNIGIQNHPADQHRRENNDERPRTAERRHAVGDRFAERSRVLSFAIKIAADLPAMNNRFDDSFFLLVQVFPFAL